MDVVLLAVIGLVVLLGIVAIAYDAATNRGWSWGTIAASILLLLAATGYIYLAARLAERERSWREKVAKSQKEIDRIQGTDGTAAEKSLPSLRTMRDRWTRALAYVDTWHGRKWEKAHFTPPRDGQPGTIRIEMASEESEASPLAAGAELAVFDDASVEDEGRFLGLFRVQSAKANKGDENALLTIVPASAPASPSEADKKLWQQNHDEVTVYESLPVDRWWAFYKTVEDPAAPDKDDDSDGTNTGTDEGTNNTRWMPQRKKTTVEASLKNLEAQMQAFQQHDREVPEDEWPQLGEKETSDGKKRKYLKPPGGTDEIHPGRFWATVTFTKSVKFTKENTFTLDDAADAKPADDEQGEVGEPGAPIGAPIAEGGNAGEGGVAISPEPTSGAINKWFDQKAKRSKQNEGFHEGETAEFDLQTALELQDDKQWARITSVKERRPLADPFTAIRGSEFSAQSTDGKTVRLWSQGTDAIRQSLLVEMESIDQAEIRVKASRENVEAQTAAVAEETKQLNDDLKSWEKDVTAATTTAQAFDDRLRAATVELASLENSIVRLGRELTGAWATLTESIDAATSR